MTCQSTMPRLQELHEAAVARGEEAHAQFHRTVDWLNLYSFHVAICDQFPELKPLSDQLLLTIGRHLKVDKQEALALFNHGAQDAMDLLGRR